MIDAVSGAIYVIGGFSGYTGFFHDVWASTDRGERAGLGRGGTLGGYLGGTEGVLGPRRGSQVRVRGRACACACKERVRLRVCSFVCLCSFVSLRACQCVYACLCGRMCVFVRY